jgi:hypothetical protein
MSTVKLDTVVFNREQRDASAEVTMQAIFDLIDCMHEAHDGSCTLAPRRSHQLFGLITAAKLLADPLRGRLTALVEAEVPP